MINWIVSLFRKDAKQTKYDDRDDDEFARQWDRALKSK